MAGSRSIDPYDGEVGLRIRSLRQSRRMSQSDLADRLGLTFQQVQKYEKGTNRVSAGRLQRIAEIFSVPVSAFFATKTHDGGEGHDPFACLHTTGAVQLLEAYDRIQDGKLRRALLELAERIALVAQRPREDEETSAGPAAASRK